MVADVGRDRIRDEVAERATGRRTLSQLARREAQARPVEEGRPVGEVGQVLRRRNSGPASGYPSRGATATRASSRTRRGSRQVIKPEEGLGRQDQRQVG